MANIKIRMRDGTVHDFPHVGRAGGSYTKSIRYEGSFAIVEDEYGKRTAFPAEDIERVEETSHRGGW